MKWAPAVVWFILAPRTRLWGLIWLGVSVLLSLVTLPSTIIQLQALFGFGARPIRLDYLVFLWAFVPWLYRQADPFRWLRPSSWQLGSLRSPRAVDRRVREFLGLRA